MRSAEHAQSMRSAEHAERRACGAQSMRSARAFKGQSLWMALPTLLPSHTASSCPPSTLRKSGEFFNKHEYDVIEYFLPSPFADCSMGGQV